MSPQKQTRKLSEKHFKQCYAKFLSTYHLRLTPYALVPLQLLTTMPTRTRQQLFLTAMYGSIENQAIKKLIVRKFKVLVSVKLLTFVRRLADVF